jgi:uncharacterized membrane protein
VARLGGLDGIVGALGIATTIGATVYANLVLKIQVRSLGPMPEAWPERARVLVGLLLNPWVLSCFAAGLIAFIAWVVALTKFDLSYAYPFMSLSFVLVALLSGVILGEELSLPRVIGFGLVVLGLIIGSTR